MAAVVINAHAEGDTNFVNLKDIAGEGSAEKLVDEIASIGHIEKDGAVPSTCCSADVPDSSPSLSSTSSARQVIQVTEPPATSVSGAADTVQALGDSVPIRWDISQGDEPTSPSHSQYSAAAGGRQVVRAAESLLPPTREAAASEASEGEASDAPSHVSYDPEDVPDIQITPGRTWDGVGRLALVPGWVAKSLSNTIGFTGLATGYGIGKIGEALGQCKPCENLAWQAGMYSWMYSNGVLPTVEYDPIDGAVEQELIERFNCVDVRPENMNLTPLITPNHTSYLDGPIMATLWGTPRFVAKADCKNIPMIGSIMHDAEVVFVDRGSQNSRQATKDAIEEHCSSWKPGKKPLAIFPEGTTTNGESLLPFKQGAFSSGQPVRPVVILFTGTFNPGVTSYKRTQTGVQKTSDAEWATAFFGHMVHGCHIRVLQPYIPSKEERERPSLYARNVREVVLRELNVTRSEMTAKSWKTAVDREDGGLDYECGDFSRLLIKDQRTLTYNMSLTEALTGLFGCVGVAHDRHSPPYLERRDTEEFRHWGPAGCR